MWYENFPDDAKDAVGNWLKFNSYAQFAEMNPKTQLLIYLDSGNQSDLLDESNKQYIENALETADPDNIELIRDSHWAVGYLNGVLITAIDNDGNETPAWRVISEIAHSLSQYPILDEDDFSRREYEEQENDVLAICETLALPKADDLSTALWDAVREMETGTYPDETEIENALINGVVNALDSESAVQLCNSIQSKYPDTLTAMLENIDAAELRKLQSKIAALLK
jgi:hypothetical protein